MPNEDNLLPRGFRSLLSHYGYSEKEIDQLDDVAFYLSNERIPVTVGQVRAAIIRVATPRKVSVDAVAEFVWKQKQF